VDILAAYTRYQPIPDGYIYLSGTSMATPHVRTSACLAGWLAGCTPAAEQAADAWQQLYPVQLSTRKQHMTAAWLHRFAKAVTVVSLGGDL
jgi:hypothetical protein